MIVAPGRGRVDLEQNVGLRLGNRQIAVETAQDAAQYIDVGFADDTRCERQAGAQWADRIDDRMLHLLERETHQTASATSAPDRAR